MEIRLILLDFLFILYINCGLSENTLYSAKLVHRFSDEAKARHSARVLRNGAEIADSGGAGDAWPKRRSLDYYRRLLSSDIQRQKLKLNPQFQFLYPSRGSATLPLGNDFGWLHYMWIDIGTPNVSFLVALDAGSDLLWVPCNCVQCAPLSSSYYSSLDKDLSEYNPSGSSTGKTLSCSHQLCEFGLNCENPKQQCPYTVNYSSDETSTSGVLVEDVLLLVSGHTNAPNMSVRAPVIIGCGSKQTGGYLNGVAPDGLMGLGRGEISVPSRLAKAGLIRNSFSLCFTEDDSGRLFLGDQGVAGEQSTSFLSSDKKNLTYIVGVDACCIGSSCLEYTNFDALVDSGTSFTFLPGQVYERVVKEFNGQVNASKSDFEGYPWQYCYKSSSEGLPKIPSLTLKFATNNSFVVHDPVFVIYGTQGAVGFCLAIQPTDEDIATIGQNFMTGYRMVYDRENFKLGWSRSNCQDLSEGDRMPLTPSADGTSPNPLPTTVQQNAPNAHAVGPAVAEKTPSKSSATCQQHSYFMKFFFVTLLALHTCVYTK
ncbi:Aspartic proteinase-like protein 1 [Abeliophyllum distichum]|uniref:Aspartic proteinase-like protein 1 n=1 Tax=Abeliophyllum distichum TaxID=126358 RepID=A0ABD1SDF4_9LAMI